MTTQTVIDTKPTILVVEDERIISLGIQHRLTSMGYEVLGAAVTGQEGVDMALALRPDLVLMDVNLGRGIDGVNAAGLIREQFDVPIVFLTAYSDEVTLDRAKTTDPFGYVLKPYEDRDLQTAIEIGLYRFQMERRLRENERWLAATLASIGDGLIATDDRGRVRFMNSLAEELTGWTQGEAAGHDLVDIFEIVERTSRAPVTNPVAQALERGESVTLAANTVLLARGGVEYPIDDSAAPIRDVNGDVDGAVLVFRDVTERCRLEDHLRQAQKMEAIGRLAGGIAHDFNNIITVITGYSEYLIENPKADVLDEYLRQINLAGKRAAALTQQILAFSRKQLLVPSVLSLNAIVRDMGGMVRRLIGEQIEFAVDLADDLGQVKADPSQMGQVIMNLAINARDAMPLGGRLQVSTRNVDAGENHASGLQPGRYACLSVEDTGCGMAQEVLDHLFEPFFTTKGVGQGTGLGLASVYGIVNQSGGYVDVSSRVGAGTAFKIYLPLVAETKSAATAAEKARSFEGGETVLLVEDEKSVRRMTKMVLEHYGYHVLEAVDGKDAVALSDGHDGPIDLLVTDLVMPQMSGRSVAERVARDRPALSVLFMSGYSEDDFVRAGVAGRRVDFLPKPFDINRLMEKVRGLLERHEAAG